MCCDCVFTCVFVHCVVCEEIVDFNCVAINNAFHCASEYRSCFAVSLNLAVHGDGHFCLCDMEGESAFCCIGIVDAVFRCDAVGHSVVACVFKGRHCCGPFAVTNLVFNGVVLA